MPVQIVDRLAADLDVVGAPVRHGRAVREIAEGKTRRELGEMVLPLRIVEGFAGELGTCFANDPVRRNGEDLEEAWRQKGETQILVHLPDPVAGAFRDISEPLLAELQQVPAALHFGSCLLELGKIPPNASISNELAVRAVDGLPADLDVTGAPVRHLDAVGEVPERQMRCKICIVLSPVRLSQLPSGELGACLADNLVGRDRENLIEALRQVSKPEIRVHLPDPVAGTFRNITEPLLA